MAGSDDALAFAVANPRTRELEAETGMADLPDLRRRIGAHLSDEEFLLRATMPTDLVDAMQAAGPAPQVYDPDTVAVMALLREVLGRRDVTALEIEKEDFKLDVHA